MTAEPTREELLAQLTPIALDGNPYAAVFAYKLMTGTSAEVVLTEMKAVLRPIIEAINEMARHPELWEQT